MDDYKDFKCFKLLDDGEKEEIEVEAENIEELFGTDKVFLLVRYDLRRLFIWKGPRAPVRKRFISSRVGAQIQSEASNIAMYLKIVSVDAGDEPIEFLRVFNLEPYEVEDIEKVEDMYYLRNEERRKLEDAALQAKKKKKKGKKIQNLKHQLEQLKKNLQLQRLHPDNNNLKEKNSLNVYHLWILFPKMLKN